MHDHSLLFFLGQPFFISEYDSGETVESFFRRLLDLLSIRRVRAKHGPLCRPGNTAGWCKGIHR
jgi:hypothetical protein